MPESPRDQRGQGSLKPSFGVSRHGLRGMVASSQHEARGHWVWYGAGVTDEGTTIPQVKILKIQCYLLASLSLKLGVATSLVSVTISEDVRLASPSPPSSRVPASVLQWVCSCRRLRRSCDLSQPSWPPRLTQLLITSRPTSPKPKPPQTVTPSWQGCHKLFELFNY